MIRTASRRYLAAYRGLPRNVWLLALVLFVNRSGMMVFPFLALYLTNELEFSDASAGWMMSVYGIGSIGGAYLGGRLSESFGALRVQTVCMFLAVPLFLLAPLWDSWPQIAASLFVLALANEAVRPANNTAIARVTDNDTRPRAFALQRLASNLGFSIGPALGGHIAKVHYALLFVVDALTTLLAALALLYFFRMRRHENPANEQQPVTTGKSPLSDRRFVLFLALMLATYIVFMQFLVTYPLYLHDHFGLEEHQIGYLFAVNTLTIVLFEMVLVDYARRWSLVRLIGWGSFLACLGFGMLPFGSSTAYCVLAMIVVTIGEMLSFPSSTAYVARLSPPGNEGRYMGWATLIHSLAWVVAPTLGATIYGINPEAVWYGALAVGVVVLAGFRFLSSKTGQ
ncbi:MAG: MFS transporter [Pirellulales bacterium]|nr:MFS transporter [Pirellulales bacterium]